MRKLEHAISAPMHHAYLIFGEVPPSVSAARSDGDEVYVLRAENPIGVDDVRVLHEYAYSLVGARDRKVLVVAPGITVQAQNALLKVIEEIQRGLFFFLCFPAGTDILPTLMSRCYIMDTDDDSAVSERFAAFMAKSSRNRLRDIDALWDGEARERHVVSQHMLQNLERHIHGCIADGAADAGHVRRCMRVATALRDGIHTGMLRRGTMHLLAFI